MLDLGIDFCPPKRYSLVLFVLTTTLSSHMPSGGGGGFSVSAYSGRLSDGQVNSAGWKVPQLLEGQGEKLAGQSGDA